ncbi:MAG: PEP-CTERM sorting domain-containing protein [Aquabacterium sp.]
MSGELLTTAGPAVPEPGTVGLMLAGLAVVGGRAWRQRRAVRA